jgi:hypothetical protein
MYPFENIFFQTRASVGLVVPTIFKREGIRVDYGPPGDPEPDFWY